MRLVLALCAIIFAVPVSAATHRISVVGSYDSIGFNGFIGEDAEISGFIDAIPLLDDLVAAFPSYSFLTETSGNAVYTGTEYTDCTGVLERLCVGSTPVFSPGVYSNSIPSLEFFVLTPTTLSFDDDRLATFTLSDGRPATLAGSGIVARGTVTHFSISEVPVPMPAFLLLSGLAALLVARPKRRSSAV